MIFAVLATAWANPVLPGGWTPGIHWLEGEAAGLAASHNAGDRPLLLDFRADWCAACGELDTASWPDRRVVEAARDFIPVRVDCTDSDDAAVKRILAKYQVRGLPTVVWTTADGHELARSVGFVQPAELLARFALAMGQP